MCRLSADDLPHAPKFTLSALTRVLQHHGGLHETRKLHQDLFREEKVMFEYSIIRDSLQFYVNNCSCIIRVVSLNIIVDV